jgi:phage baseplate assembly protein W
VSADPQTSFLGRGWAFPVRRDASGDVARAGAEDLVAQSIWLILATAPGERVQRPDFGCGMHELVFAPNTATTAGRVADAVRDALVRFEPRIDVLDVRTSTPAGRPTVLLIEIDYRIRTTNNRFNLVYPFYLQGAGGPG